MTGQYIVQGIFALAGIISLLASFAVEGPPAIL